MDDLEKKVLQYLKSNGDDIDENNPWSIIYNYISKVGRQEIPELFDPIIMYNTLVKYMPEFYPDVLKPFDEGKIKIDGDRFRELFPRFNHSPSNLDAFLDWCFYNVHSYTHWADGYYAYQVLNDPSISPEDMLLYYWITVVSPVKYQRRQGDIESDIQNMREALNSPEKFEP